MTSDIIAGPCPGCTAIFFSGLADAACYRVPTGIKTSKNTILAFAEQRKASCGDNGLINMYAPCA